MAGLHEVLTLCMNLDEALSEVENKQQRKEIILKHFEKVDSLKFTIPDFKNDLDWLNVSEPLSLSNQLAGKVLVLDFFTYCCINCMHVLPDLEHLESKVTVKDGVVIVGVHSAKFLNEKVTANILSAILRYDIKHPVVNDSDGTLWHQLEISCWPTFLLVGPQGQYIYAMVGEGHREKLMEFVEIAVEHYKSLGQLKYSDIQLSLEKYKMAKSNLQFPGKVCVTDDGDVVVADSGNNRVLILQGRTGVVQSVIGSKERGFQDGDFSTARFSSPQGVVVWDSQVFVADTENHAIRQIDLKTQTVRTIAGTGHQGNDKDGGKSGTEQEISSPWDLTLGWAEGASSPNVLYIAMSGTHQIWAYFLQDTKWYKGSEYKTGTCVRFAGSGNEENRNNSYPAKAGFAQPSGLSISPQDKLHTLYVADSESSTVRMISLKDGAVKALVGGERDPTNLFAYGDVDGVGVAAKLQHPLAVALATDEGPLLVADSYNNKIKSINLKTKECTTLIDSNQGRQLSEPGGLFVDQKRELVYIADTNNNAIKVYDLETKALTELPVVFDNSSKSMKVDSADSAPDVDSVQTTVEVKAGGQLDLTLTLDLDSGNHLNEEAPNAWKLSSQDSLGKQIVTTNNASKGKLKPESSQLVTRLEIPDTGDGQSDLILTFQLFICGSDNACRMKKVASLQPLRISPSAPSEATTDIRLNLES